MDEVKKVTDYSTVKTMSLEDARAAGLYETIGAAIDDAYIAELKKLVVHQDAIDAVGKDLKIVYTPLHGTGNIPVRRVLKELGFENVYVVPEQELPDGDFPTVSYPNPEAEEAFALGLALGRKVDADLILATDPDADRLGVYVKDSKTGEYHSLTGNMSGCLIGDYIIGQKKAINGSLPADGACIYQYGRCHCRILWHSVNRSINRIQVYRWQNLRVRKDRKRNLPLWYGRKLRLPDRNLCKR